MKRTTAEYAALIFGAVLGAILGPIIGALLGALGLVVVSWVFPMLALQVVTLTGFQIYQLGAMFGILSYFVKSVKID